MDKRRPVDFCIGGFAHVRAQQLHKLVHPHIEGCHRLPFLLCYKLHWKTKLFVRGYWKWFNQLATRIIYVLSICKPLFIKSHRCVEQGSQMTP